MVLTQGEMEKTPEAASLISENLHGAETSFKIGEGKGLLEMALELGWGMVVQASNPSTGEECEFKAPMAT